MRKIFIPRGLFLLPALFLFLQCREPDAFSDRIHTSLDLIDIFPQAIEKKGGVTTGEMSFEGGGLRSVIQMAAGDLVTFRVYLHEKASLHFKWGIKKARGGDKKETGTAVILIKVSGEKKERTIFKQEILAGSEEEYGQWREEKIDLDAFSGQRAALAFSVEGDAPLIWGLANPMIRSKGEKPSRRTEPERPNIVLVSVDTLRADHLKCYGYPEETSPAIDRLAAGGVLFERAYAQAHWTLPSHMSLFTSLYPDTHRVPSEDAQALDENIPTLASILHESGYLTGGFAKDCGYMSPVHGLNRGFNKYSMRYQEAEGYRRRVERWLEDAAERKFFLFLHLFDPHSDAGMLPYEGPEEYIEAFTKDVACDFSGCRNGFCASQFLGSVNDGENTIEPDEVAYLRGLYNAGIREADDHLGFLIETLEKLGLKDSTLLVFSSDHGEEFMEHGKLLHSQFYEELIHVPLIFYYPKGGLPGGKRVRALVENIDILPTILEILGIEYRGTLQGRSLAPHFRGEEPPEKIVYGAAVNVPRQVVRSGPWKLILHREGGHELFNLDSDPKEKNNCVEREKDIYAGLLKIAGERWEEHRRLYLKMTSEKIKEGQPKLKAVLSQAEKEHLQALGYLE